MEYIFKDIQALKTPVGEFTVHNRNRKISFSVIKNEFDVPYEIYENQNVTGEINISDTYHIIIDTSFLEIGSLYSIVFLSGKWEFCASDENTYCYCTVIDDWCVGIGIYDQNEDERLNQALYYSEINSFLENNIPKKYDESKFVSHTFEELPENNGYSFRLLDKSWDYIQFQVAWIETEKYSPDIYKKAIGFWLT